MSDVYKKISDYFMSNETSVILYDFFNEWNHGLQSFVCHKSHADVVLAMLNGAKGQCRPIGSNQAWSDCNLGVKGEWSDRFWYVSDKFESRIVEEK